MRSQLRSRGRLHLMLADPRRGGAGRCQWGMRHSSDDNASGGDPAIARGGAAATSGGGSGAATACSLVTVAAVSTAIGEPMSQVGGAASDCSYSNADHSQQLLVHVFLDQTNMNNTVQQLESSSEHVDGLGDDAFWNGTIDMLFVRKGERGFTINSASLGAKTPDDRDAPKNAMVTLATAAFSNFSAHGRLLEWPLSGQPARSQAPARVEGRRRRDGTARSASAGRACGRSGRGGSRRCARSGTGRRRDLTVGLPGADQGGDALLDGGQLHRGGPAAEAGQLGGGLLGLDRRAEADEHGAGRLVLAPRVAAVTASGAADWRTACGCGPPRTASAAVGGRRGPTRGTPAPPAGHRRPPAAGRGSARPSRSTTAGWLARVLASSWSVSRAPRRCAPARPAPSTASG